MPGASFLPRSPCFHTLSSRSFCCGSRHSFKEAVRAFERINTLGVKLKKEDIESANIAVRHSGADHL
jgi:hypothetical protein